VELAEFTATTEGNATVCLSWTTALEENSARFGVERSLDGTSFSALGAVPAVGSSTCAYAFLDHDVPKPQRYQIILYYRLRQVDADGTFSFSPVRSVSRKGQVADGLSLAPNPARTTTLAGAHAGAAVKVFDALDRLVLTAAADAS
jgi:hypothetical protein